MFKNKKVKVADVKQLLVDEMKIADKRLRKVKGLEKQLEKTESLKKDYEMVLASIDSYKSRIEQRDVEIIGLKKEINKVNDELYATKEKLNNETIKGAILQDKINNYENDIDTLVSKKIKETQFEELTVSLKENKDLKSQIKSLTTELNTINESHEQMLKSIEESYTQDYLSNFNYLIDEVKCFKGNLSKAIVVKIIEKYKQNIKN